MAIELVFETHCNFTWQEGWEYRIGWPKLPYPERLQPSHTPRRVTPSRS